MISLPAVVPTPITGRVLVVGHGNSCRRFVTDYYSGKRNCPDV